MEKSDELLTTLSLLGCNSVCLYMCRLLQITRQERLKTDLTTLLALCEKADNDIRSCLNTLQVFFFDFYLFPVKCMLM